MLVRVDDEGALAIGQLSHSWISGQLARAWGNDQFSPPRPREEVALGAEQHDIGWALFDREPPFNPQTGLPLNFLELSVEQHLAIWRDAPDHLLSQSAHAALVVSLHGRSISELRANAAPEGADALREHVEQEIARQAELCGLLGLSADEANEIRRQMWAWDGISLALCNGWRPFTISGVPGCAGPLEIHVRDRDDSTVALDPWPFATDRVSVRCEGRRLAARYADESAMREAFERAPVATLTFALAPL